METVLVVPTTAKKQPAISKAPWWAKDIHTPWYASREYAVAKVSTPRGRLRNDTAYLGGRRIADGFCILSGIAAAVATITYIVMYANNVASQAENGRLYLSGSSRTVGPSESEVYAALIVAAAAIGLFVAAVIIRQIMHSLFDIADCALKRHQKSD
jgi:hypothetical protein